MTPEDLRAAVAAGILGEAQAASLQALVNDRSGKRATLPSEDEPFEFFRGFSEIFISIGLVILMTGLAFVCGVLPMVIASGAGGASQQALGTSVMGGMIAVVILALLMVPVFFVVVQRVLAGDREPKPVTPEPEVTTKPVQ